MRACGVLSRSAAYDDGVSLYRDISGISSGIEDSTIYDLTPGVTGDSQGAGYTWFTVGMHALSVHFLYQRLHERM